MEGGGKVVFGGLVVIGWRFVWWWRGGKGVMV